MFLTKGRGTEEELKEERQEKKGREGREKDIFLAQGEKKKRERSMGMPFPNQAEEELGGKKKAPLLAKEKEKKNRGCISPRGKGEKKKGGPIEKISGKKGRISTSREKGKTVCNPEKGAKGRRGEHVRTVVLRKGGGKKKKGGGTTTSLRPARGERSI